jgi:hypothetical protein
MAMEFSFFRESSPAADVLALALRPAVAEIFAGFLGQLFQTPDGVRVPVGEIVGFADIVFQIEEGLADLGLLVLGWLPGGASFSA